MDPARRVAYACDFDYCEREFKSLRGLSLHRRQIHRPPVDKEPCTADEAEQQRLAALTWNATVQANIEYQNRVRLCERLGIPYDSDVSASESDSDASSTESDEDQSDDEGRAKQTHWDRRQHRKFRAESYPEAGWACDAEGNYCETQSPPPTHDARLHDPTNPYFPFENELSFEFARLAEKNRFSKRVFDDLLHLHRKAGLEYQYKTRKAYRKILKKVPYAKWTEWEKKTLGLTRGNLGVPEGFGSLPSLDQSFDYYIRDTEAVLRHLLSSPAFSGHQSLAPEQLFQVHKDGSETRFYSEPLTGTEAWDFQCTLPDRRHFGIRIDTGHDATALAMGTGTASAHPIYLSLGNNAGFLKRGSSGGMILIGYFPNITRTDKGNDELWRLFTRRVKHCVLEQLWQPIKRFLTESHLFLCADGHYRFARVYFGPTAVDYPEACWLLGVASGHVVCCTLKHGELHQSPGEPRTSAKSAALRDEAKQVDGSMHKQIAALRIHGLNFGWTVWDGLGIDGHKLCGADSLHQLIKGMVKDITIDTLLISFCKDDESKFVFDQITTSIGAHLRCMPMHSLQRRFKDGFLHTNWTGAHTRKLMNIFPAAIWEVTWVDKDRVSCTMVDDICLIMAILSYIIMHATSLESTEESLEDLELLISEYMLLISENFTRDRVRKNGEVTNLNWPRLHAIGHYPEWTRKWGVAPHSNTADGERAHIDYAKVHWRASNKCNADGQIREGASRSETMRSLVETLTIAGRIETALDTALIPIPPRPVREVALSERAGGKYRRMMDLDALSRALGQEDLVMLTADYLGSNEYDNTRAGYLATKWQYSFKIGGAMYKNPPKPTLDAAIPLVQTIWANPSYPYRGEGTVGPRFDCVFVHTYSRLTPPGRRGETYWDIAWNALRPFTVFHIRGIFSVKVDGLWHGLCIGDEFEWDENADENSALLSPILKFRRGADGKKMQRVFPIEDVLRSAFVQPLFGQMEIPPEWNFQNIMDNWDDKLTVNLVQDQHVFHHFGRVFSINILRDQKTPWSRRRGKGRAAQMDLSEQPLS